MNQSWRIGRIGGIPVDVHATFGILLAFVALSGLVASGVSGLAVELVFTGLLFGAVLAHELGHAFTARAFGVETAAITLLPFGGVAQLVGRPARPEHELLIALAGPAVNMAAATALVAVSGPEAYAGHGLLGQLLWVNVGLALFNLIPAFPMDGGRVLRAWLSTRLGPREASYQAATVGQVAAVVMGVVGLFGSPMLVLIAIWVWLQAEAEKENTRDIPPRVVIRRIVRWD